MIHVVPVSGGKDSQLVLELAIERHGGSNVVAVHQNTGIDHPYTYAHLEWMEVHYGVRIVHVRSDRYLDLFDFIRQAGYFPNARARGCTSRLKQRPFAEWLERVGLAIPGRAHVHLGMRAEESRDRREKYGSLSASDVFALSDLSDEYPAERFGGVAVSLDIVDWPEGAVFARLAASGAKVNPLYSRGHKRVGCYPCLCAPLAEWEACAGDYHGRRHIRELGRIQAEFEGGGNTRKLIKVHRGKGVMAIVRALAAEPGEECQWCSI